MIVDGESKEGKGGDTKRQEKPEGAILEDSRMWVKGERWIESVVLMGTVWFGLDLLFGLRSSSLGGLAATGQARRDVPQ
jgi:hypothetical protein